MRTKTLLLAAALSAAGIAASLAQSNVYSVNIVGYVNQSMPAGNILIGNQLDLDGNGTNNTIHTVFGTNGASLANGTTLNAFNGVAFSTVAKGAKGLSEANPGDMARVTSALQPGQGLFINSPAAQTVTFVGNVMLGHSPLPPNPYPAGYSVRSSQVAMAGDIQAFLGFVPASGVQILRYDAVAQNYVPKAGWTFGTKNGWQRNNDDSTQTPGQPSLLVFESVVVNSPSAGNWQQCFPNVSGIGATCP
jgi:hypothetical protein